METPDQTETEERGLSALWKRWTGRLGGLFGRKTGKRAAVPTILQMEAVECGAAALAMVLARYGLWKPLEELRVACGVSRDGSKASNLLKAARQYGLVAKGYRKEPENLRDMQMPVILHWNFNHFLVLEGFQGGKVHLADPAQGPVRVSEEELDESFTGVVLTFEPGPDFEKGGSSPSLVRSLVPRLATSTMGLIFVVMAGLGLMIPGLLAPTFNQIYVDDILVRGLDSWLRPMLLVMGITAIVQIALSWLRQRYLLRLETKLALVTSAKFLWHVLRLPIEFYNQRYAGEIGSRVAINDKVANLLSGELATTLLNLVVIAFYAALMIQYDVVLTVVSVSIALINMVALKLVSRTRVDLNQRLLKDRGNMLGVAMGGLQTIETLKATGSEDDCFSRWAGQQAKVVNSSQRLAVATQMLSAVPPLLLSLNTAVILGLGGLRVIDGHLSMGMLMAYQALMLAFINPVNRLVTLGGTLQEVEGDINRLDDVLRAEADQLYDIPSEEGDGSGATERAALEDGGANPSVPEAIILSQETAVSVTADFEQPKLEGSLELSNVVFGYSRLEKPLIHDFSINLDPGMRIALVGGSGCGKSTIARLVAGLYEIWDGEILFDDKKREQIPRQVLANSIAFVDQDIFLFEGTIHDNLTLWDSTIQRRDLVRAAKDSCILDEITSRPGGFDSMVSEGGANFSGGQRQRLEIARALVLNPTMLVLDEATSALDPTTEKIIDDNLRRRGVTCLIVAHRLSTIRDCDEIIVMERGGIAQRGNHETLMEKGGLYSRLIAAE